MKKSSILIICILLSSCSAGVQRTSVTSIPIASPSATTTPRPPALWIDPAVPSEVRQAAASWNIPLTDDSQLATLRLEINPSGEPLSTWVYALVAPFPTVIDEVSSADLISAWQGAAPEAFAGQPILMDESTLAVFTTLWGPPAQDSVERVPADQLLGRAWAELPAWAIIPFEQLQPRWKVIAVDGQSPIRKEFEAASYPLGVRFSLLTSFPPAGTSQPSSTGDPASAFSLPVSNRDPEKLTTIILTGVTALVRATAYTMEAKGVTYPGRDIRDSMRAADIAHISNEVPFYSGCAFPNPGETSLSNMCSSPRYIDLLTDIGADVVELTGNHFNNAGVQGMLETLQIYKDHGIQYYGGGQDINEALKPLELEHNGNKIAFIGCKRPNNAQDPSAAAGVPGAAPCDFDYLTRTINELHSKGYVVIFTFQWNESYGAIPHPLQQQDFRLVADAGASIVSGSQAHYAQIMEFYNDAFIHYGLGNLFFDQMGDSIELTDPAGNINQVQVPGIRRLFHDRYILYDGRTISTELLTSMLEDFSRPRPMTRDERAGFLQEYFNASGWTHFRPTPTPQPTLTLTPIHLPEPAATPTP